MGWGMIGIALLIWSVVGTLGAIAFGKAVHEVEENGK
jgi:hypothetical protein